MTPNALEPGSLADRVIKLLGKRSVGFEVDDEDVATEFGVPRRHVARALEPLIGSALARRAVGSMNHWRLAVTGALQLNGALASMQAGAGPPQGAPVAVKRPAGARIAPPDPALFTPKPFTALPELRRKRHLYRGVLDKLRMPGLCIEGLDARWRAGLNEAMCDRHRATAERYSLRKGTNGTLGLYRLPNAKPDAATKPGAAKKGKP